MYNESYDTYIRSILGYSNQSNIFNTPNYDNSYSQLGDETTRNIELEDYYPDIYKVAYPMVVKACRANTRPVTKELVENMTDEIIMSLENMEGININVNLRNDIKSPVSTKSDSRAESKIRTSDSSKETTPENRSPRIPNRGLRDIIRILLLRELLGFPGWRPPRPPHRPPFRPPFPGGPGPGPGGPRPPIRPRDYNDIYEF